MPPFISLLLIPIKVLLDSGLDGQSDNSDFTYSIKLDPKPDRESRTLLVRLYIRMLGHLQLGAHLPNFERLRKGPSVV